MLADDFREGDTIDVFHQNIQSPANLIDIMAPDNVRMLQSQGCFGFLNEALADKFLGCKMRVEDLHGEDPLRILILHQEHFGHATFTQLPDEMEFSDFFHSTKELEVSILILEGIHLLEYQGFSYHIMQSLFLGGEAGHNVADKERKVGENFRKKPSGSPGKIDPF